MNARVLWRLGADELADDADKDGVVVGVTLAETTVYLQAGPTITPFEGPVDHATWMKTVPTEENTNWLPPTALLLEVQFVGVPEINLEPDAVVLYALHAVEFPVITFGLSEAPL